MAGLANHVQKILARHVPMIRFKYGANRSNSGVHLSPGNESASKKPSVGGTSSAASSSKAVDNSVSLEFAELPAKYRRRPLTDEEIDLVTIGGRI